MFINPLIITHNIAVTGTASEILGKEPDRKKQIVLVMIQIYWFRPENNVSLMLIDNQFACNGCQRNIATGSYINTHS